MEQGVQLGAGGLVVVNLFLALIMFGVGLGLDLGEFRRTLKAPVGPTIGLVAQFLLLPALAFGFVRIVGVSPGTALGVLLVCSCPGGTVSNVITHLARANVSLSIAMTAVSTFLALALTPLNLAFWGARVPGLDDLDVALDPLRLLLTLVGVMGVPVLLGVWVHVRHPQRAARLEPVMRRVAVVVLVLLIVGAGAANASQLGPAVRGALPVVVAVNLLALALGYGVAALARRPVDERRAITIEVGIQNAALAVTLALQFFPTVAGAATVAALWGVWHQVTGLTLARIWSGEPLLGRARRSAGP